MKKSIALFGALVLISQCALAGEKDCRRFGLSAQAAGIFGLSADVDFAVCSSDDQKAWLEVGVGAGPEYTGGAILTGAYSAAMKEVRISPIL